MHVCPQCQSDRLVSNGSVAGKPKKLCKPCGFQFTRTTPRGKPLTMKINAVLWYLSGISMNRIAFLLQVSVQSVLNWLRTYAKAHEEKPEPTGTTIVLELDERKQYFRMIRKALGNVVVRPITPEWGLVEEVLSDALQDVLQQGAEENPEPDAVDKLLRKYVERLQAIPHEYMACAVVPPENRGEGDCPVVMQTEKSFGDLADDLARNYGVKTDSATLAKVNGRDESECVSRQNMNILLVPKPVH
jgi:transposase